jgi:hypothetical protein
MCKRQRVIPRHKCSPRYRIAYGWKNEFGSFNHETLKFLMHFRESRSSLYFTHTHRFFLFLYIYIFISFSLYLTDMGIHGSPPTRVPEVPVKWTRPARSPTDLQVDPETLSTILVTLEDLRRPYPGRRRPAMLAGQASP